MITEIHVIVLLRYHETHYIATPMYSSHFKSYSLIACSMLVTYTTQPTHFARHYIQVIMTQNVPFLLLTRDQQHICTYEVQTCYSGPITCCLLYTSDAADE